MFFTAIMETEPLPTYPNHQGSQIRAGAFRRHGLIVMAMETLMYMSQIISNMTAVNFVLTMRRRVIPALLATEASRIPCTVTTVMELLPMSPKQREYFSQTDEQ